MVGAAVLPRGRRVYGVRDSKMLPEDRREALFDRVAGWCSAWAVGAATQVECDSLGMAEAQRLAARRALEGLGVVPDLVLIDGKWDFVGTGNTVRIVRGDARCLSIAAASMLAKVTRDRQMRVCRAELSPLRVPGQQGVSRAGVTRWRSRPMGHAPSTGALGCSWTASAGICVPTGRAMLTMSSPRMP